MAAHNSTNGICFKTLNRFFKLMNLLRPKPVLKRVSTLVDEDEDNAEHNYRFLLKWQVRAKL